MISLRAAPHAPRLVILLITLVAFGLRVWQLDAVPPGWRDDELIEALVISQKVLDGDLAVYYPDASGHEALYHVLAAIMLILFEPGVPGIRWLSAILGTLTVPLTYVLGRRLFSPQVGLLAAAGLALSFWALMYSRFGMRHINMPVLMLPALIAFWQGISCRQSLWTEGFHWRRLLQPPMSYFLAAGVFMGLGFYTYFAARGIPLILLAFCAYLWLFHRPTMRRHWAGALASFGVAFLLAIPLLVTLAQQPEAEARISEVGRPLMLALEGDFSMVAEYTIRTLSMFHNDGDDEWLYNIPYRPVFGPVGAVFFWSGVLLAGWGALGRKERRRRPPFISSQASAFLLLWWLAGITPGFLSIPAGSLGHTIAAQPAVYILAALPVWFLYRLLRQYGRPTAAVSAAALLSLLLLFSIGARDLPDYFREWPQHGMVRFLYRADIHDLAQYLNENPALVDIGISGMLAGPWDRLALELDLDRAEPVYPRWYHPERAILLELNYEPALNFTAYPPVERVYGHFYEPLPGQTAGDYQLARVVYQLQPAMEPVCFENGLCLVKSRYLAEEGVLEVGWRVERPLTLPPIPVISNPPPPGVYAGPRLSVFAHLLDEAGEVMAIEDGFWVDPQFLQPGDLFLQQHQLAAPMGETPAQIRLGLYDPKDGRRILTEDGRDRLYFPVSEE